MGAIPTGMQTRQVFDPLLAWARDTLGAELAVDDSIFGANQPSEAIQTLRHHLEGAPRTIGTQPCAVAAPHSCFGQP